MGKTKEDFKQAFKAVKKPNRPKGVPSKLKSSLETAMDREGGKDEFVAMADRLYKDEPGYFVDLIAYKFAKHFDDGGKARPFWVKHVPKEALDSALRKAVPGDASDRLTQATLERAVAADEQDITGKLIYARDPKGTTKLLLDKYAKASAHGDEQAALRWGGIVPTSPNGTLTMFKEVAESGNSFAARNMGDFLVNLRKRKDDDEVAPPPVEGKGLAQVPLDHDRIVEVAQANPKLFAAEILQGKLKGKNEFVEIVTNPKLQDLLKNEAPDQWEELVKTTPVLSLMDQFEKKIDAKKLTDDDDKVAAMFDAVVNNEGMPLSYYTSSYTPSLMVMTGGMQTERTGAALKNKQMGEEAPDGAATQCHSLLHILEDLIGLIPDVTKPPKVTQGTCDNILLTAPLPGIPGKGLLDKSFTGNVFDDTGAPTKQILFTGDAGINSHTWLVINGKPFDPVLGTRGAEVAASIEEQFDWLILDRVGKGANGTRYVIKGADRSGKKAPKAATNKMGFGSGYWLTTDPAKYLTDEELEEAKLKPKVATKPDGAVND